MVTSVCFWWGICHFTSSNCKCFTNQFKNDLVVESVEVYNHLGQIVQSELGSSSTIDVSRLSKGSYLKIRTKEDAGKAVFEGIV